MQKAIIERQVSAMQTYDMDAFVCCSPENFAYGAGFVVPSQALIRHRHAMTIATASGATGIFGVDMEASTIKRYESEADVRIWAEFSDDPMLVLADQLKGYGLERARNRIEMDYLPISDFLRLKAAMPHARFEPNEAILAGFTANQDPERNYAPPRIIPHR